MRVLVLTNIFPNARNPTAASFNRQQLVALARYCEVDILATLPWFPLLARIRSFSPHGTNLGRIPRREVLAGLTVLHPRTLYVPRIHSLSGGLYVLSLLPHILRARGRVDAVLGSWAYPDGWAAVVVGALLGVPAVVKVHGSDVLVVGRLPGPARMLRWVLPRAARVIAVSRALAEEVVRLGVPSDRVDVVYNGVDGALFHPRDRGEARRALGRDACEELVLFVGNLLRTKGAVDLLEAFGRIALRRPRARLVMVGRGAERGLCEAAAAGLGDRVTFTGPRTHEEIAAWMGAADVLSLPSWSEGMPNVILEALASGRRVVASAVGGIPELIVSPRLGELVAPHDIGALAEALDRALGTEYDPAAVAAEGRRGDWAESAGQVHRCLLRATGQESPC